MTAKILNRDLLLAAVGTGALVSAAGQAFAAGNAPVSVVAAAEGTSTVPAAAGSGNETLALEEIVVTAQKRAESVDKVPISISVFDQASMQKLGVVDINDIANMSPGVDYQNQGPVNNFSIRGVYSSNGASTTAIYIDDVPLPLRVSSALGEEGMAEPLVFDLDHVEVLRGPQGTLFGAGAEGGAIRFITPQPSLTDYSGYARAGAGITDNGGPSYEVGAAFGGPIVQDTLGFRVSAWDQRVGGYINHESAIPGGADTADANYQDNQALRVALTYAPTQSFSLTPSFYYQHRYTADVSSFDPGTKTYPDAFTYFQSSLAPQYSNVGSGQFVNPTFQLSPDSDQLYLPELKAVFHWDDVQFTSATAYLYRRDNHVLDGTNSSPTLLYLPWPTTAQPSSDPFLVNQNVLTQEVRAQNADADDRLQWTVGFFYTGARQETDAPIYAPYLPAQFAQEGLSFQDYFGTTLGPNGLAYFATEQAADTQKAGFTQLTYELTELVSLTAGVRVAHETDQYGLTEGGAVFGGATTHFAGVQAATTVDPKAGVDFHITDNNLVYLSAAKGDRIGGVNPPFIDTGACAAALQALGYGSGAPATYKGDSLWSYELGSKNKFFDGRLDVEASAFHIDWSNIQQAVFLSSCTQSFTSNLGKAVSNGGDLQIKGRLWKSLTAGLSVSYTNAKDTTTITSGGSQIVTSGDQINPYAAPWIVVATLGEDFPLADDYSGYVHVDDEYHSRNHGPFAQNQPDNAAYAVAYNGGDGFIANPAYNILNIHVGVTKAQWDVSAYALNALNSHPLLFNSALLPEQSTSATFTYRPLTVGFTVAYRWR
jgi:iron complex outermembrane recepter protein